MLNISLVKNKNRFTRLALSFIAGIVALPVLAWNVPHNLVEKNDHLLWDSDAPSYNIYENGNYIATVHGESSFGPILNNRVYQVVAHNYGAEFSPLSDPFLFSDEVNSTEATDDETLEFAEAELFFELNNTDGDLGIHSAMDGGPWTNLRYEDANGENLLEITLQGAMAEQGLTQLFFESAEPTFDELAPSDFFARFPGGMYSLKGISVDGANLESKTELSQVIPSAPVVYIGRNPSGPSEGCKDVDAENPPVFLNQDGQLNISWDPVTSSHPTVGVAGEITIDSYLFVFATENINIEVELNAGTTAYMVPAEFINSGDLVKLEILVKDDTHNQVATEACVLAM